MFVACLPYSDYAFAISIRAQGVEYFIYALSKCLAFFVRVPKTLVPDILKAVYGATFVQMSEVSTGKGIINAATDAIKAIVYEVL